MISPATARVARATRFSEAVAGVRAHGPLVTWGALGVLLLGVGAWLVHLTAGATFWADEWAWILHRRGNDLGTFLKPHNDHLSLLPIAIYRVMFATFGVDHYGPFRVLVVLAHCGCVVLIFLYARRRLGDLLGLAAAASLLLLGPAWQDILWPFQLAWLLSMGAGVAALLALDRRDRRGDVGASALLTVSLASSGVGLPIALGMLAELLLTRPRRRLWIVVAPLIPYAVWWQLYEKSTWASTEKLVGVAHPLLDGLWRAPSYSIASAGSTLAALAGLSGNTGTLAGDPGTLLLYGPVLLAAAGAVLVWRLRRLGRVPVRVIALGTMALSFWAFTAITRGSVGDPYTSRYLYVGGILVLLLAAELSRGVHVPDRVMLGIVVAVTAACASNVAAYLNGASFFVRTGQVTRAGVSALDVAGPRLVKPGYLADSLAGLTAGPYFAAEKAIGSPAVPPSTLAVAPAGARQHADSVLIAVEGVTPRAVPPAAQALVSGPRPAVGAAIGGTLTQAGSCVSFQAAGAAPAGTGPAVDLVLPPGHGVLIRARGGAVDVGVRRFGDNFHEAGTVRASGVLSVPRDHAPQPWRVRLGPAAGQSVCGLG
jgi:hypothetical protein